MKSTGPVAKPSLTARIEELLGLRGPKEKRAIRWADLKEVYEQAAGRAVVVSTEGIANLPAGAPDLEDKITDIDAEIQAAVDAAAAADLIATSVTTRHDALVDGFVGKLTDAFTDVSTYINLVQTNLSGQIGTISTDLSTNYLTSTQTNSAIVAASTTLSAQIDGVNAAGVGLQKTLLAPADAPAGAAVTVTLEGAVGGQASSIRVVEGATARNFTSPTNGAKINIPAQRHLLFAGQRVKIAVQAKQVPSNSATKFGVAYSCADGNSGYMAATENLTASLKWFYFHYTVPASAAGGDAWLGIFGDNAKSGKGTQVTKIFIEIAAAVADIETLPQLAANVTSIMGVDIDALSGTGLAVLLNQLEVNSLTGSSAWITEKSSVVAGLQDNASASYALRVKAGSGGALLELTAADNPTGPASFARIVADDILLAGSVTTKQMLITDGNLFGDSLFLLAKDESVYTRSGLVGTDFETYTSGWAGFSLPQVLQLKAGIGYNSGNGGRLFHKRGNIEGVPGSSYHFSCYVGVEAGGTAGQTTAVFSIYIYKKSENGTLTYARSAAVWAASNAASGVLSGSFTLAKDENVIVPVFRAVNETGGVTDKGARFNNPVLRRMNGGELVVDGGITAQKLSVPTLSAITADVGILRTATSGARLEIRGDQILVYDASGTLRVRMGNLV